MTGEIVVVCSRADLASLNICERLLERRSWVQQQGYRSWEHFRLLVHDERQTALSGLDAHLAQLGLNPSVVVFASRHEAKAAMPWFGGHFTGLLEGENAGLSQAAPLALRSFLQNIRSLALPGYAVSAEATHHGPVDVRAPCFFAEIGSTGREWQDRAAGVAAAEAILAMEPAAGGGEGAGRGANEIPVFLGFGGGHYVPRQTELMSRAAVSFGHMFSSYQTHAVNADVLEAARARSNASLAFIDRKSLKSDERKRIEGLLSDEGLPVLRSREILAEFPLPQKSPLA